ncbi:DUF3182 family protein [Skermanella stibiiresistens]|nr:DUF3182 family protein [Skermanella stibiiresistens]
MTTSTSQTHGTVVGYPTIARAKRRPHETETRALISRKLAALKGCGFAGDFDPSRTYPGPLYHVPDETLVEPGIADRLGIRSEHDLFGGVVPHAFVATKAITHPLVDPAAAAPAGWSHAFASRIADAVLAGFTVFSEADAHIAFAKLLAEGPVRIKPVHEKGGQGQSVARTEAELTEALAVIDRDELAACGLVLEENLAEVETHSVGQVRVADLTVSYFGTQRLTPNNRGVQVYGGTELLAVRGGYAELTKLDLPEAAKTAITQACAYDTAAMETFPGMFVSRRNYDIAVGFDAKGRHRSGVLEQSWRLGGASGAEIAALEGFRANPRAMALRTATVELYGEGRQPPSDATIYFHGVDEHAGPLLKYTVTERP